MMRSASVEGKSAARRARPPRRPALPARCCRRRRVLRPVGREAGRLVAAPDHHIGRRFDLRDLVAVDHLLVAGEVQHLVAGRAQRLADREQHRVAESAADKHHRLAAPEFPSASRSAHQDHRFARLQQRTQIRRAAHLQHDRGYQAALAVDPGAGQRKTFHRQARAFDVCAASRSSADDRTAPAGTPRGQRRAHDDFDDVRRQSSKLSRRQHRMRRLAARFPRC